MDGGGGNSGPTLQEQQLQTQQALTTANLNLEENQQRKSILNSMYGTRVYRGSALSRALVGNTPGGGGEDAGPAPSRAQTGTASAPIINTSGESLFDQAMAASGATPSGGTGASANSAALTARAGSYGGAGGSRATRG